MERDCNKEETMEDTRRESGKKYMYVYMSAERNDQTKKVNNRFRPPETNVVSGRVG